KCYVWQLGGTIENRVIPDIEEICRKLEILVFADTEVLANRDIPVLLKRTTEGVSAQVAETGFSIGTNHRSGAKSCRIKIVVDSIVDVPQIGLVIDSGIECRVATGSRIQRFGPGVGSLEVKRLGEAVCRRDL